MNVPIETILAKVGALVIENEHLRGRLAQLEGQAQGERGPAEESPEPPTGNPE